MNTKKKTIHDVRIDDHGIKPEFAHAPKNGFSSLSQPGQMSDAKAIELARQTALLASIAELGGKGIKEEDIVYEGETLRLPERFRGDVDSAIEYLVTKRDEEEKNASFTRTWNYRPWDGARNAFVALKKAFGLVSGHTVWTLFGPEPPTYQQIPTGVDDTEEIPWGEFSVPLLGESTRFTFGQKKSPDYGLIFNLTVSTARKNRFIVEGLFKLIGEELKANSIYRGKAIDGQQEPTFVDLSGFDPDRVIYSEQVQSDLEAHVFAVMRYAEKQRDAGLPLKRSILLAGPYGTGKTLAGFRTAAEAQAAGWTFIMARPGRDNFADVMQTARLYQPAVVFMEDAENVASAENSDAISQVLDIFDGIQSKTTDLMVVLTTNKPEELHKGMMRPGRLDAIIEIGALDAAGVERLVRSQIGDKLGESIDWAAVAEANMDYMPAFVAEGAGRAIRYALARNAGDLSTAVIETSDLVYAAGSLRSQFARMQDAPEVSTGDKLANSLRGVMQEAATLAIADLTPDPTNGIDTSVWSRERLEKVNAQANSINSLN